MATLFVACARCGFETTIAPVRTVAGFACPRCGDRAVELLDLAPERRRLRADMTLDLSGLWDALAREQGWTYPRRLGCFAPGTVVDAIDGELVARGR
jgi:hypothetical protein